TALSLVVGTLVMGTGLWIAIRHAGDRWMTGMAGVIVGLGVVALHYVGLSAVRVPGSFSYDADLVAASVLFSVGFGAAALHFGFGRGRRPHRGRGAVLLLLMTVTLHFTAMGAANLTP